MKYTHYFFLLFLCLSLNACSDDDDDDNGNKKKSDDRTEVQKWIETKMRERYFWDIPAKPDYKNTDPKEFFMSLLSDKDGKTRDGNHLYYYSYIEDVSGKSRSSIQEDYSYGFEFTGLYTDKTWTTIQALVLYVIEDSPAGKAGLRRGDWIIEIDGKPITSSDYATLSGGKACRFTIMRWDVDKKSHIVQPDKISIESARKVEDHPVFLAKTLHTPHKNKTVGYLVYNHFTDGKDDNDESYDDKLREVSGQFKNDRVEEFVLDLRYNNGGLLSSALVLSAILAPESAFGQDFAYMQYKDKTKYTYKLDRASQLKAIGKNLNLKTLYVLTSSSTASASELIINSLRPFMGKENVILIGERTEGKNVGSISITSDDKQWVMHPIVGQIYNKEGKSDYADGFPPDHELDEAFEPVKENTVRPLEVLPLGDPDERLLAAAIGLIDGTAVAGRSVRSSSGSYRKAPVYSLDRKATSGVVIDEIPTP